MVSTYQAGKVILVRADGATLNTHFRAFGKPMAIAADPARLTVGDTYTVWYYRNVPAVAPQPWASTTLLSAPALPRHRRHRHPRDGL